MAFNKLAYNSEIFKRKYSLREIRDAFGLGTHKQVVYQAKQKGMHLTPYSTLTWNQAVKLTSPSQRRSGVLEHAARELEVIVRKEQESSQSAETPKSTQKGRRTAKTGKPAPESTGKKKEPPAASVGRSEPRKPTVRDVAMYYIDTPTPDQIRRDFGNMEPSFVDALADYYAEEHRRKDAGLPPQGYQRPAMSHTERNRLANVVHREEREAFYDRDEPYASLESDTAYLRARHDAEQAKRVIEGADAEIYAAETRLAGLKGKKSAKALSDAKAERERIDAWKAYRSKVAAEYESRVRDADGHRGRAKERAKPLPKGISMRRHPDGLSGNLKYEFEDVYSDGERVGRLEIYRNFQPGTPDRYTFYATNPFRTSEEADAVSKLASGSSLQNDEYNWGADGEFDFGDAFYPSFDSAKDMVEYVKAYRAGESWAVNPLSKTTGTTRKRPKADPAKVKAKTGETAQKKTAAKKTAPKKSAVAKPSEKKTPAKDVKFKQGKGMAQASKSTAKEADTGLAPGTRRGRGKAKSKDSASKGGRRNVNITMS